MKDKNDNTPQADQATVKKTDPVKTISINKTKKPTGPLVLTVIAAALLVGGTMWYVQKSQKDLAEKYDSQLQALVQQTKQNERLAQEALSTSRGQAQQVQRLSKTQAHTTELLNDINVAVQTMSATDSDIVLLNDIEQLITLAQQQLMIGGNLANAIVSLETAQARLAHANRQNLATLMQTINGDLDRLRAVQVADVATVTAQLNRLKELLNQAPLYVPDSRNSSINGNKNNNAKADQASESIFSGLSEGMDPDAPWWHRTLSQATNLTQKGWETISQDLGQFVSIRRVEDSAALLMSAEQADRLRDNLSLRVTMAQLALMTKQTEVWRTELAHIITAIEQRFDPSLALTQRALALATKLEDIDIDVKLPSLDNSLAAIESLKQADQSQLEDVEVEVGINEKKDESTETEATPKNNTESTPSEEEA